MRWHGLFADLEAQLEAADAAELSGEIGERSRREAALVHLVDRLRGAVGAEVSVWVPGQDVLRGVLVDCGPDWLLLDDHGREALVPSACLSGITGLGARASAPALQGAVAKRLDLRWALRGLARDRRGVSLGLVDGTVLHGTLDRVGADHLDLAEHGIDEARRPSAVRSVRLLPLAALAVVRSR
jgi:hypothetical protein